MRIMVIGGTGFIGPSVVTNLWEMGHEITVFHRGKTLVDLPGQIKHILGDRRHLADFTDVFRHFAPQVVLDMFPFAEEEARSVMNIFRGISQRVVAISSQDVYRAYGILNRFEVDAVEPVPMTEDARLREELYPYRGRIKGLDDYEKILVERVVMNDPELVGTILRLPMVYGPRDKQHRLFEFLKRMDDNRPAILLEEGLGQWRWTHGYVENVAAAIVLAIISERAKGRIYNVGDLETMTMAQWVEKIGQVAGWSGKVIVVPTHYLPTQMRTTINTSQHLVIDTNRMRKELGYQESVPLEEALKRTIIWERTHPPDKVDPDRFDYATEDIVLQDLCRSYKA